MKIDGDYDAAAEIAAGMTQTAKRTQGRDRVVLRNVTPMPRTASESLAHEACLDKGVEVGQEGA
jgi:hypothetical protein